MNGITAGKDEKCFEVSLTPHFRFRYCKFTEAFLVAYVIDLLFAEDIMLFAKKSILWDNNYDYSFVNIFGGNL